MNKLIPLASLLLLGVVAVASEKVSSCPGCRMLGDPKEPENIKTAQKLLQLLGEKAIVVEVVEVDKQVVAGSKTHMTVKLDNGKKCELSYLEQPWVSLDPQDVTWKCAVDKPTEPAESSQESNPAQPSRKRFVGGLKDMGNSESDLIKKLADIAVATLDDIDEDNIRRTVIDVMEAKKQLVNGIIYHLKLRIQDTSCLEGQDITIDDTCISQTTGNSNICLIQLHGSFAANGPHPAKVATSECKPEYQFEGIISSANTSSPYIRDMANYSVNELNMMSNSLYVFKLADISRAESQVTDGIYTYLTVELRSTNCLKYDKDGLSESCQVDPNQYTKMTCHLILWENPRTFERQMKKSSCLTDEIKGKGPKKTKSIKKRAILGGESSVDPNEQKIEELKLYISSQLTARANSEYTKKVVEVLNSTTQVVSGTLTRATVRVANTNCLKSENKSPTECQLSLQGHQICSVTILEQPWLSKKELTQSECHAVPAEEKTLKINWMSKLLGVDSTDKNLINFSQFVERENRMYKTVEEMSRRFKIFRANMLKAAYLNKTEQGNAVYGATMFADMTKTEFKRYLGLNVDAKKNSSREPKMAKIPQVDIPSEFDWREQDAVTPVKNQGQCGSCWAFSVTGNIEGLYAINTGQLTSFSEQELVDCDKLDDGCNGGFFNTAYESIEQLGGLEPEKDYPYHARGETCHLNSSDILVSVVNYVNITSDENEIAKYLVANGPISIGINANAMQFYMGGVSHPLRFLCNPNQLDHGVLIVGYGIHRTKYTHKLLPYWLIKNSWGPHWGNQGYYMAYRGDGTCGLNKAATSAIIQPV